MSSITGNILRLLRVSLSLLVISCGHGLSPLADAKAPDPENTVRIYKKVAPATVFIKSVFASEIPTNKAIAGIGSGVLLNEEGLILTNAHMVAEADRKSTRLNSSHQLIS